MAKILLHQWKLQRKVDEEAAKYPLLSGTFAAVQACDEVARDEQCSGLGRCSWTCEITEPDGSPPTASMVRIKTAIIELQKLYDIGVTAA